MRKSFWLFEWKIHLSGSNLYNPTGWCKIIPACLNFLPFSNPPSCSCRVADAQTICYDGTSLIKCFHSTQDVSELWWWWHHNQSSLREWANCTVKALRLRIMTSLLTDFRVILIDRAPLKRLHQIAGLGTPPLLEGKLLLLHESWSGSKERPSKFFGALKGGEFPLLHLHFLSTP